MNKKHAKKLINFKNVIDGISGEIFLFVKDSENVRLNEEYQYLSCWSMR